MSRFQNIMKLKCPRCTEGDLYEKGTLMTMKESCDSCGQKYVIEPGFYWGAMYVAYGLSGFVCLVLAAILFLGTDWSTGANMTLITIAALIIGPLVYKYSRSIWIHMFVKEDLSALTKK